MHPSRSLRPVIAALLAVVLAAPATALAWSSNGHMMIAALAYRSLPHELQARYAALLHHHPDYDAWQDDFDRLGIGMDLGEYLFMRASLWPDEIRRTGGDFNHPTWHYTNFPLRFPDAPMDATLTPENDVLFGIGESLRILGNSREDARTQAAHLSWIIHLIGDLHQPLHAVALVNDTYPNGDRGGNDVFVRPRADRRGMNLHAFWDQLLGTSGEAREARNQATLLGRTYRRAMLPELDTAATPYEWAMESRQHGIDDVYLQGRLDTAVEARRDQAPVLPADYPLSAKMVAERRAALAAYRLADALAALAG